MTLTPGLLLSNVENPQKHIESKKKLFDQVHPKQYLIGNELKTIKENSGIQGMILTWNEYLVCLKSQQAPSYFCL